MRSMHVEQPKKEYGCSSACFCEVLGAVTETSLNGVVIDRKRRSPLSHPCDHYWTGPPKYRLSNPETTSRQQQVWTKNGLETRLRRSLSFSTTQKQAVHAAHWHEGQKAFCPHRWVRWNEITGVRGNSTGQRPQRSLEKYSSKGRRAGHLSRSSHLALNEVWHVVTVGQNLTLRLRCQVEPFSMPQGIAKKAAFWRCDLRIDKNLDWIDPRA